eukprot:scaffold38950_cov68-Phaeocystis_antarctica.AAC.7
MQPRTAAADPAAAICRRPRQAEEQRRSSCCATSPRPPTNSRSASAQHCAPFQPRIASSTPPAAAASPPCTHLGCRSSPGLMRTLLTPPASPLRQAAAREVALCQELAVLAPTAAAPARAADALPV